MTDEASKKDMEVILRGIPSYLDIVIIISMWLLQQSKQGLTDKRISCKNIIALLQFSQNLMQGGLTKKDPFLMLPHVGEKEAGKL